MRRLPLALVLVVTVASPAIAQGVNVRLEADRLRADASAVCAREPNTVRCSQARNLAIAAEDRYDRSRGVARNDPRDDDDRDDRGYARRDDDRRFDGPDSRPQRLEDDDRGYAGPPGLAPSRARPMIYRDPTLRAWADRFFDRNRDRQLDQEEARRAAEALLLMADFDNDRRLSPAEARYARDRATPFRR